MTDGNLSLEGRTVWLVRAAGTPVVPGERLGEGGQGVVHAAQAGGASCAVKLPQLPGGRVVLTDGASVTSHHLHRDRNHETVVGMVEAHSTKSGEVVLRNVGPYDWVMTPEREAAITVPSKRRLGVRTMVIDFGSVTGRISVG